MSLDERFQEATVNAKKLTNQSNENLLNLYSLFKQATAGDVSGPKPGGFDFKGKAKYDAWSKLAGTSQDDAKEKYIALVAELGA